jgi:uncharacterized protein (DUF849 family)
MSRTTPLVITSANTGAAHSPDEYRHIPVTPRAVVDDVRESYLAGAGFCHIHALNPMTGVQFADVDWYREVREGIRHTVHRDLAVGFPTSRKGEVDAQIRDALKVSRHRADRSSFELTVSAELLRTVAIHARPDSITSFTAPEILAARRTLGRNAIEASLASYGTHVRWQDAGVVREYYRRLRRLANERGVRQELEITTSAAFTAIEDIAEDPTMGLDDVVHVVFLLGFSSRLPITRASYDDSLAWLDALRRRTGVQASVSVGVVIPPRAAGSQSELADENSGPGHPYRNVLEWVREDDRVDAFRVGLEDTPVLYGQHRTNAWLVHHVRELAESSGIVVETDPRAARARLRL